jgi:hypothetical protein
MQQVKQHVFCLSQPPLPYLLLPVTYLGSAGHFLFPPSHGYARVIVEVIG